MLHLKCDAERARAFDTLGLPSFVYEGKAGKRLAMKYRRAPDEALETPAEMRRRLRLARAAARAQDKRYARKPATARAKTKRAR